MFTRSLPFASFPWLWLQHKLSQVVLVLKHCNSLSLPPLSSSCPAPTLPANLHSAGMIFLKCKPYLCMCWNDFPLPKEWSPNSSMACEVLIVWLLDQLPFSQFLRRQNVCLPLPTWSSLRLQFPFLPVCLVNYFFSISPDCRLVDPMHLHPLGIFLAIF